MKRFCNYTFRAVCIYILILVAIVLSKTPEVKTFDREVLNANITKELNSVLISKKNEKGICFLERESSLEKNIEEKELEEQKEKQEKEISVLPTPTPTPIPTPVPTPTIEPTKEPVKKSEYTFVPTIDTNNLPVLATTSGNVSHYGHDCYGCTSGRTATGYDISDGRIYYTDPTFGSVRIVAAGSEYPYGTILRLSNASSPIIAIVLDRGGAIGSGKRYILDLLTESNAAAYQAGVRYNTTIEVLRMGY